MVKFRVPIRESRASLIATMLVLSMVFYILFRVIYLRHHYLRQHNKFINDQANKNDQSATKRIVSRMLTGFLFIIGLQQAFVSAEELRWDLLRQNDYDVIPHRVEVLSYNKNYVDIECFEFVKYNRTSLRTLNASGTLLKKIEKPLIVNVQLYKFLDNTYKYFPVTVSLNACREYKRGSFLITQMLSEFTNIDKCPPDPGHYYVYHFAIDYTKLPPYIPRGDFKASMQVLLETEELGSIDIYTSIVDKKKKWGF